MPGQTDRVPVNRTADQRAQDDAFYALYGPWDAMDPVSFAIEMEGFDRPWWVVGGWAIEAATGFRRKHEDTDISILACDVPAFVDFMTGRWHVWNNVGGVLRPLVGKTTTVDEPGSQLWLRADATSPWVIDVPLTPDVDGRWSNKFMPEHVDEIEKVTWVASDGIRYLQPEIVLAYKARLRRPKDDPDFDAALRVLSDEQRAWLREALERAAPDHHWLARLSAQ